MKRKLIGLAAVLLTLSSCVSQQIQKLNPTVYYRNDLCFSFDTRDMWKRVVYRDKGKLFKKFCGASVLPYAESYEFEVQGYGKLDFFSLTTCHEEVTTERPDKGIFKKNGKTKVRYVPTLEKRLKCPLFISAYNKRQRHAWGVMVFETPDYKLNARVYCNGHVSKTNGVSICQSRAGLIQRIEFDEPVKPVAPVSGAADRAKACPVIANDGDTFIQYPIPERECIYGFIGKRSGEVHQHYSIGYEEIIIRE